MNEAVLLRSATVQEIQLELIRRNRFNTFDGEKIVASLLAHRDLWQAVLLDRPGLANYAEPGLLLMSGLIKLRDLPDNIWNADCLFILTETHDHARRWVQIAEEEEWCGGMPYAFEDQKEIDSALGTGRQNNGLVKVWWD